MNFLDPRATEKSKAAVSKQIAKKYPVSWLFLKALFFPAIFILLASGCADKREPRELQEHFRSRLRVVKSSIRGGLVSFDISGEKSSATIFVRKFENKKAAVKFVEEASMVTKYPLLERSGQWIIYLENWSNGNFLKDEKFKDDVLDVFWDW